MYTPEYEGYPAGYFPPEEELLVTSAPLKAAAFYIGDQCQAQNDDYMLCKDKNGLDPFACLAEGRRVTNCTKYMYSTP
jgi:NADH dehydrogenase (ubiquinone) 1 alpha subcomplex subunit 8